MNGYESYLNESTKNEYIVHDMKTWLLDNYDAIEKVDALKVLKKNFPNASMKDMKDAYELADEEYLYGDMNESSSVATDEQIEDVIWDEVNDGVNNKKLSRKDALKSVLKSFENALKDFESRSDKDAKSGADEYKRGVNMIKDFIKAIDKHS